MLGFSPLASTPLATLPSSDVANPEEVIDVVGEWLDTIDVVGEFEE